MYTATRLLPEVRYLSINKTVSGNGESDLFIVFMVRSPVFQNLLQINKVSLVRIVWSLAMNEVCYI